MVIVELLMLEHYVINVVNYFEQHPNAMHYLYFVELQQLLKNMVVMDMVLTMWMDEVIIVRVFVEKPVIYNTTFLISFMFDDEFKK